MNILESSRYEGPFDTRKRVAIHSRNEKKKEREIPYLQANMCSFVYYVH